jgi:5'-3' exonuclease
MQEAVAALLADPVRCSQACGAAYCRSRNYRPASIANDFVKAVWQRLNDISLLLVDRHNLLFRACFGTPARIWSRDPGNRRDITTQFMFFALLRKAVTAELGSWPEILVVFDGENGSAQRKEADPGYKATRPGGDEALRPIRAPADVKAGLDACQVTWTELTDTEADDVIATHAAAAPGRDVLIMSADQDYYRLLRDRSQWTDSMPHCPRASFARSAAAAWFSSRLVTA